MWIRTRLSTLVSLAAMAAAAPAQTWVTIDTSKPPGTPAKIVLDEGASSVVSTTFDVFIYGFWETKIVAPDNNKYYRIEVPGLDRLGLVGAPDVPVARVDIVSPTDVPQNLLVAASVLSEATFPNRLVWPQEKAGNDEAYDPTENPGTGDTNGTPDVFTIDPTIYGLNADYPTTPASAAAVPTSRFSGIPAARQVVHPVRCNPTTQVLKVAKHSRFTYRSLGGVLGSPAITKDAAALAGQTFVNWPEITGAGTIVANQTEYDGRYLIVTPPEYVATLAPFVEYRKSCGLAVTVHVLPSSGGNICGNIRGVIDTWYQAGNPNEDHYCLLVGDQTVIPQCVSPNIAQVPTDDLYGSPSGSGDLDEEVFVGRLSVDDAADLAHQIAKIKSYELDPLPSKAYRNVVLVAHKEDAPGKYVGAHETVANATYADLPIFKKQYGSISGVTDASVRALIDGGVGLVAYRGHGSSNTWSSWNLAGDSFHKNDVLDLNNTLTPVVWSFSCTNSNLNSSDCIGETWLEDDGQGGGGVAHYGSTVVSGTGQNHVLDEKMFEAVYDRGLRTHSHAIAWAEGEMADAASGNNSWMYMLLGDPFMKIRTKAPKQLTLVMPDEIEVCTGPNCFMTIAVQDQGGFPVPGILVSVYKPGLPNGPDEIFWNGYTGTGGTVVVPGGPTTLGKICVTGRDDEGNTFFKGPVTTDGAWADLGFPLVGVSGAPSLEGTGTLQAGTPAVIGLSQAAPSAPAILFISPGYNPLPFEGGTLVPTGAPLLQLVTMTTAAGNSTLSVPSWPAGFPPDYQLYFQYAIADQVGPVGVALSNCLRGTTP